MLMLEECRTVSVLHQRMGACRPSLLGLCRERGSKSVSRGRDIPHRGYFYSDF